MKSDKSKIFFSSDFHFGHKNICYGVSSWNEKEKNCRMFNTIEEMNIELVNTINNTVGEDDILYFLGDFSFSGIDNIWIFRKQIKCKNIIFIEGNHDHHVTNDKILPNCHYDENNNIVDGKPLAIYNDDRDELFKVTAKELFITTTNYL